MKTMKKLQLFVVVAMLVIFATSLVGCQKLEEFEFSEVETTSNVPAMEEPLKASYTALFSQFKLSVSSKEFILKTDKEQGKMPYKKDGDKYVFQGEEMQDMVDALNAAYQAQGISIDKVEVYGEKIEDGWAIVYEEEMSASGQKVRFKASIKFEKDDDSGSETQN